MNKILGITNITILITNRPTSKEVKFNRTYIRDLYKAFKEKNI